jgi:hypothetical protein
MPDLRNGNMIEEVVAVTMRNCLGMGKSYNPGAFQRIVSAAKSREFGSAEMLINRLCAAFRIEERNRFQSYWGA